jgi:butyryl-CoA dehydrogenase
MGQGPSARRRRSHRGLSVSQIVNRRDVAFILYELLGMDDLLGHPRYAAYDRGSIEAVLDLAQQVAEDHFLSCAAVADRDEPRFIDGKVRTIPEVAGALAAFGATGLGAGVFDESVGGLQLPTVVNLMTNGMFSCANLAVANYLFLTTAAANLLQAFGSEDQKRRFLPQMLKGAWFGTMCLSEPQAGSSLSDIRTSAEPLGEGRYRIRGSKMWISGGDHELSQNIIHLVLARLPGGLPGVKGISLFIVPRFRVHDGEAGEWNHVALAGLNHKMGQRATTNCLLNFGESGDCVGELVGEPHKGLRYMFHMMNEARIGVGHAAVMCALGGYLHSLDYARTRLQGRRPHEKDPASPQLPIVAHADVRRMLMAQKAAVEGGLALVAYGASLVDRQKTAATSEEARRLGGLLDLLTPIIKSWPSEYCLEANKLAIQILGGYGYTRDFPVERLYRDNRLNHIHEGTYGIQGLDLLGRKVGMNDGASFEALLETIEPTIQTAAGIPALGGEAKALGRALSDLVDATLAVSQCDDLDLRLANATLYLDAFGHVVVAWLWLRQAIIAHQKEAELAAGHPDRAFYAGKIAACRYFYAYEVPHIAAKLGPVLGLDRTCLDAEAELFIGH